MTSRAPRPGRPSSPGTWPQGATSTRPCWRGALDSLDEGIVCDGFRKAQRFDNACRPPAMLRASVAKETPAYKLRGRAVASLCGLPFDDRSKVTTPQAGQESTLTQHVAHAWCSCMSLSAYTGRARRRRPTNATPVRAPAASGPPSRAGHYAAAQGWPDAPRAVGPRARGRRGQRVGRRW